MTNKEEEGDRCQSKMAGLMAIHLVSQVLDEAYVIANAAIESGQQWRYLDMLNDVRSGKLKNIGEGIISDRLFKADSIEEITTKIEEVSVNLRATSTPQKVPDKIDKKMTNNNFIGQGDVEIVSDLCQSELNNPTSMFISHLFDMSEVEHIICHDSGSGGIPSTIEGQTDITEAMTTLMEQATTSASVINAATEDIQHISENGDGEKEINENDVARYENAFLTLNRDFDQCSDEDLEPVLEDPKEMQEVDLEVVKDKEQKAHTVEPKQPKCNELTATSAVSASSRKSSLVKRCRNHGARLLACLRGWWRRKTPGKRKEARVPGSVRGLCPLSPDARRRAASLLDQSRLASSLDQPQHVVWKFNTLSEALVNSSRWKNYTFDANINERGEYL